MELNIQMRTIGKKVGKFSSCIRFDNEAKGSDVRSPLPAALQLRQWFQSGERKFNVNLQGYKRA